MRLGAISYGAGRRDQLNRRILSTRQHPRRHSQRNHKVRLDAIRKRIEQTGLVREVQLDDCPQDSRQLRQIHSTREFGHIFIFSEAELIDPEVLSTHVNFLGSRFLGSATWAGKPSGKDGQGFHVLRRVASSSPSPSLLRMPPANSGRTLGRDHRGIITALEPLGHLQPQQLPLLLLDGRIPAPLRVPHHPVVPQGSRTVTTPQALRVQPEYQQRLDLAA